MFTFNVKSASAVHVLRYSWAFGGRSKVVTRDRNMVVVSNEGKIVMIFQRTAELVFGELHREITSLGKRSGSVRNSFSISYTIGFNFWDLLSNLVEHCGVDGVNSRDTSNVNCVGFG